jgi:HAD superfamily hydrolase (TIGR01509 family)
MNLHIPEGEFRALLFDCDGTIADSMPLQYVAWKRALGEHGCEFPEDTFYAWGGKPAAEIIATLGRQQGIAMPIADVAHRKEALYYEMLPDLRAVPEVLAEIERNWALGASRLPMAVVSGSTRGSVTRSLVALDLLDRFATLVCAGDYTRSKPDPEPFLTAAHRLGVAPANCLVFEDTAMGIQSATAAGMASIKILQPWERK